MSEKQAWIQRLEAKPFPVDFPRFDSFTEGTPW
jgi:hypothetical protein